MLDFFAAGNFRLPGGVCQVRRRAAPKNTLVEMIAFEEEGTMKLVRREFLHLAATAVAVTPPSRIGADTANRTKAYANPASGPGAPGSGRAGKRGQRG